MCHNGDMSMIFLDIDTVCNFIGGIIHLISRSSCDQGLRLNVVWSAFLIGLPSISDYTCQHIRCDKRSNELMVFYQFVTEWKSIEEVLYKGVASLVNQLPTTDVTSEGIYIVKWYRKKERINSMSSERGVDEQLVNLKHIWDVAGHKRKLNWDWRLHIIFRRRRSI